MPGGRVVVLPTDAEDARINAGLAADPDAYEMSPAEFKQLRRGRPLGSGKKVQVTLRLDADLLENFKSTGAGWQTRVNDALKSWSKQNI
jgi:uncharacterized protein (DUF4415 family)